MSEERQKNDGVQRCQCPGEGYATITISSSGSPGAGYSLRILISLHSSALDFGNTVDVSVGCTTVSASITHSGYLLTALVEDSACELVLVVATDSIMLAPRDFGGSPSPFKFSLDDLSENPSTQLCVESPSVVPTSGAEEMIDDSMSDRVSPSAGVCLGGWLSGDAGLEFRGSFDALDFSCRSFVRPSTSIPSIMCSPIVGSNAIIVNDTFCWLFSNHLLKLPRRSFH